MEDYVGLFHVDSNVIDDRCVNSQASFKNYTSSTYRYSDEKFEAALLEIHIPFTWVNLHDGNYIGVFDAESGALIRNGLVKIRQGYYHSLSHLIRECNSTFKMIFYAERYEEHFPSSFEEGRETPGVAPDFLTYIEMVDRIEASVDLGNAMVQPSGALDASKRTVRKVHVRFTPQLAQLLGFDAYCFEYLKVQVPMHERERAELNAIKRRVVSQNPHMRIRYELDFAEDTPRGVISRFYNHVVMFGSDVYDEGLIIHLASASTSQSRPRVQAGIEELFIYSSLIKQHMIGNSYKQLLRVTPVYPPVNAHRGEPIILTYDRPYYFPLYDTLFDHIEIELRDRAGELIVFESGSTIAVIDIRRKKHGE